MTVTGTNQGDRQASVRAATGTTWTYEGDWHALFTQAGVASGDFNGRLLAWINTRLGTTYSEINGAMVAFAVNQGFTSWGAMGTFDASGVPAAPVNTVAPAIYGTPYVGSTLTADRGLWSGSPAPAYTYAWKKDGVANGSTGSTYVPVSGDIGSVFTVTVTATNASGAASVTSAATAAVALAPAAPVNTVAPSAPSGSASVGATLTASDGTWTGNPSPTFTYAWYVNGVANGTTGSTYVPVSGDVGKTITVLVTGTNASGSASATSAATAAVVASSGTARVLLADGSSFLLQTDGSSKVLEAASASSANLLLLADGVSDLLLTDGASRLQLAA